MTKTTERTRQAMNKMLDERTKGMTTDRYKQLILRLAQKMNDLDDAEYIYMIEQKLNHTTLEIKDLKSLMEKEVNYPFLKEGVVHKISPLTPA